MQQQLLVDTAAVQTMAAQWGASVGELSEAVAPVGLGLSCQASAVAVNAADAGYAANEANSTNELAAVARPVTGG